MATSVSPDLIAASERACICCSWLLPTFSGDRSSSLPAAAPLGPPQAVRNKVHAAAPATAALERCPILKFSFIDVSFGSHDDAIVVVVSSGRRSAPWRSVLREQD